MKVALFSDAHGHLRVVLRILQNWQLAHGEYLDAALIAGDLGCFPDTNKLDKATRKHLLQNPEEAGFSEYFVTPKSEVLSFFEGDLDLGPLSQIRCALWFTAGNHEDWDYLGHRAKAPGSNKRKSAFAVDCYEKVVAVRDGQIAEIVGMDGAVLRVAALWGIEAADFTKPYRISRETVSSLCRKGHCAFDLLLSHDAPREAYSDHGSAEVTKVIRATWPPFHLFGHVPPISGNHIYRVQGLPTESWLLDGVSLAKGASHHLAGTLAILDWNGAAGKIEPCHDGWLKAMNARTWEAIHP